MEGSIGVEISADTSRRIPVGYTNLPCVTAENGMRLLGTVREIQRGKRGQIELEDSLVHRP